MSRLGIFNMMIGFMVIGLAASGGAFIATDLTQGFLRDHEILSSWMLTLQTSSHGHTSLFGLIQIVFGLTLPYSLWPKRWKQWQTAGLLLGTTAMGPLMILRSYQGPTESFDLMGILIGIGLSAALIAILAHCVGLWAKLIRVS